MKQKLLSLLLLLGLAVSLAVPAAAAEPLHFTDVPTDSWYYTYVQDLYTAGVVDGISLTTFGPQEDVTLGQALKLILLAADCPDTAPTGDHWASGYYSFAREQGFLPEDIPTDLDAPIQRVKIAEIAVRVLDLSRTGSDNPFADTDSEAVLTLFDHGILFGTVVDGQNHFYPQQSITRAEISAIIWRMDHLGQPTPDPNPDPKPEPDPKPDPEPDPEPDPKPEPDPDPKPEPDPKPDPEPDPDPTEYFTWGNHQIPIASKIPVNSYDKTLVQKNDKGYITYESDKYTSRIGIDVSRYQGEIDWKQVKDAGVEFAIIRLGYRGYGTGKIVTDTYFHKNIKGALAQGLDVGVYFFSQAITPEEGAEEARYCLNALKGYNITYPIIFDWEPYPDSYDARTKDLDDSILTQCAVSFCETVKAAGYQPMVYANLTYFYLHFDMTKLADYPFWLAQYSAKPTFYYHFNIWQYSSTLEVPGIEGNVDMNVHLIPRS